MSLKKPRKNTDYRHPEEFLKALQKSNKEMSIQELTWAVKCSSQTTKKRMMELHDEGLVNERCVGTERMMRFYSLK